MSRMEATPEALELAFLASHLNVTGMTKALDAGVAEDSFQVAAHAKIWNASVDILGAGGSPSLPDMELAYGVLFPVGIENPDIWREELMHRTLARRVRGVLLERVAGLEANPSQTVQHIIGDLSGLTRPGTARASSYDGEALARLERVLNPETVERGAVLTGLPSFDREGDSWRWGELVAVLGPMNVGKSTLLLWFAMQAYWSGRRVLILSPESPIPEIEAKLDPMLARKFGMTLSNRAIRSGRVDPDLYRQFIGNLESLNRRDLIIRDSGDAGEFTIPDIVGQIREHRPDVLAIDGFHLIRTPGKSWESMMDAARTIKGISMASRMVTLCVSQVNRAAIQSGDPAELGSSAYGLALEETSDRVFTMAERTGDTTQRAYKLIKHRYGEKRMRRNYLRFLVDTGDIGEVLPTEDTDTGEVQF